MNSSLQNESARAKRVGGAAGELPFVSVIMPVFNEERFIAQSLSAVLKQDYPPDKFEIIIADGFSTDQTREIVISIQRDHPQVRLIHNPGRIVSCGLNQALGCAQGEVIVRLDGHCEYPNDYVRRVLELRQRTGAANAGGVLVPMGTSLVQQAVARAYYSPVGLGGSALKGSLGQVEIIHDVDAVHGGCWERERLLAVGGFDETMVRNQDDELSFRLRKASGRVVQSNSIRVKYHVRDSFRKLLLQFAQYGYWKVRVVRKHPRQANVRHFIPALFVLLLVIAAVAAPFSQAARWTSSGLLGGYLFAIMSASLIQLRGIRTKLWPGVVAALAMMHFGYGVGFLLGWVPALAIFKRTSR